MLELKNVFKEINNTLVIDNISMKFENGKIYGLVGQNGSGKSILFKLISNWIKPTSGEICTDNNVIRSLIEMDNLRNDLTGYENIALLYNKVNEELKNKIYEYLKYFKIFNSKDKLVKEYSLGMRQKVAIIQVLLDDPDIIILDEPFNGLDEESVSILKNILFQEVKKNKIILLASHIKGDIFELSDEVYTLDLGKIIKHEQNKKIENIQDKLVTYEPSGSKSYIKLWITVASTIIFVFLISSIFAYSNYYNAKLAKAKKYLDDGKYIEAFSETKYLINFNRSDTLNKIKFISDFFVYDEVIETSKENKEMQAVVAVRCLSKLKTTYVSNSYSYRVEAIKVLKNKYFNVIASISNLAKEDIEEYYEKEDFETILKLIKV
ncbi:MAG: ABC transporter ATP-binding protein [Clostridia bacterium]